MDLGDNNECIAKVLYDLLEEGDPEAFLGEFEPNESITIDGRFNLTSLARRLRVKVKDII